MRRLNVGLILMLVATAHAAAAQAAAQDVAERQALRSQIEQRFDVLPVQGGVVLKPKAASGDVRSIELTAGVIAIDGEPVAGAEVKRRLGADADLIIRLTYLDSSEQRALFESRQPGASEPNVTPPARRLERRSSRVRIGDSVQVGNGEVINGDVVAIGGDASVDGQVRGDLVVVGGGLTLGPHADVLRDVTVVGGTIRRDPAAHVDGKVNEVGFGDINFGSRRGRVWSRIFGPSGLSGGSRFGSAFALVSTVTRLAVLCILASIVLLFGRDQVEQVGRRAASEPLKAGVVGLLIQLLFFPVLIVTIVMMIITIIGIPLLVLVPFALFAFALLFLVGFTAVVCDLGQFATTRLGWQGANPYLVAILGTTVVLSPVLLGRLLGLAGGLMGPITAALVVAGLFAEYVAWTVGLGAIALVRFARR